MIITVAGSHTMSLAPQCATVRLRVSFESNDKAETIQRVEHEASRLNYEVDELRSSGAAPVTWASIAALNTRSWRPWNEQGKTLPVRHEASVDAFVKFKDFRVLSRYVSDWGSREGFDIQHIEWALTEKVRVELEGRALALAVVDARDKAQRMAAAAGAGSVRFLEIADPGMLAHGVDQSGYTEGFSTRMASSTMSHDGIDLSPEDIDISAHVHARFEADL